jgi:HAD superfamily hydrolase (TIGR01490 family)
MALAIFDLDNTLLAGDSDYLWGQYLSENNYVDAERYQRANQDFYDQYLAGTMDIYEFLTFQFKPLADNSLETLYHWREDYLVSKIDPIILPSALTLIEQHKQQGDTLLIISATNDFITTPIAEKLGIDNLIATQAEMIDGRYTGKVKGTPSYQEGKVTRLQTWLDEHGFDMAGSYFYSDSHNDLPLLKKADNPIAVDPDPRLRKFAEQANWQIISLR